MVPAEDVLRDALRLIARNHTPCQRCGDPHLRGAAYDHHYMPKPVTQYAREVLASLPDSP